MREKVALALTMKQIFFLFTDKSIVTGGISRIVGNLSLSSLIKDTLGIPYWEARWQKGIHLGSDSGPGLAPLERKGDHGLSSGCCSLNMLTLLTSVLGWMLVFPSPRTKRKFICWSPKPQCDGIWRRGFCEVIRVRCVIRVGPSWSD